MTTTKEGEMSPGLRGILAMSLAAVILTVHDTGTKLLLETYPVNQIVTIRQTFGLIILVLIIQFSSGWQAVRIVNKPAVACRAVLFIMTTTLIVASLNVLPIATVLAVVFASPLVVAFLSVPFLGERVGPWRWAAIIAGFIGVLVILRPVDPNFNLLLLFPVAAACASGVRDLITRWAGRTDSTMSILFWSNVALISGWHCHVAVWLDRDFTGRLGLVVRHCRSQHGGAFFDDLRPHGRRRRTGIAVPLFGAGLGGSAWLCRLG